jgi:LPS export ABC transporter protein LptC
MSYQTNRRAKGYMGRNMIRQVERAQQSRLQHWAKPLKIFFLTATLMMIGAIFWYLQRPVGLEVVQEEEIQEMADDQANLATLIHLEQFDGQRTQWTLDAPSAHKESEVLVIVETPRLSIFHHSGEQINVTAERGTVDKNSRIMSFNGNVRAKGDRQFGLLSTEWLQFDPRKGILYTDQAFSLENRDSQLQGVGMTLFQETRKVHVPQKVRMKFMGGVPTLTGEWDS